MTDQSTIPPDPVTFYRAEEINPGSADIDRIAGWVGYRGTRIEAVVPVYAGAACDWTPALAAHYAQREVAR